MLRLFAVGISFFVVIFFISCGSKENKDTSSPSTGAYYVSYEMSADCSTGRQKFQGTNEAEKTKAFCDGLKDNELNNNCAAIHRENAFKAMGCYGSWPYATGAASPTYSTFNTFQYAFKDNGCSTGLHYFSANNLEIGHKIYCKAILDDEFNMNCARAQREQLFAAELCQTQ